MMLQVAISDNIVVSLRGLFDSFTSDLILLCRLGSLIRGLEVMVLLIDVADDVVVDNCVLALPIVPRLLLGIIRSIFEAL